MKRLHNGTKVLTNDGREGRVVRPHSGKSKLTQQGGEYKPDMAYDVVLECGTMTIEYGSNLTILGDDELCDDGKLRGKAKKAAVEAQPALFDLDVYTEVTK